MFCHLISSFMAFPLGVIDLELSLWHQCIRRIKWQICVVVSGVVFWVCAFFFFLTHWHLPFFFFLNLSTSSKTGENHNSQTLWPLCKWKYWQQGCVASQWQELFGDATGVWAGRIRTLTEQRGNLHLWKQSFGDPWHFWIVHGWLLHYKDPNLYIRRCSLITKPTHKYIKMNIYMHEECLLFLCLHVSVLHANK